MSICQRRLLCQEDIKTQKRGVREVFWLSNLSHRAKGMSLPSCPPQRRAARLRRRSAGKAWLPRQATEIPSQTPRNHTFWYKKGTAKDILVKYTWIFSQEPRAALGGRDISFIRAHRATAALSRLYHLMALCSLPAGEKPHRTHSGTHVGAEGGTGYGQTDRKAKHRKENIRDPYK